jgi:hypothetical protein
MKGCTIYLMQGGKTNPPVVIKPIDNIDVKRLNRLGVPSQRLTYVKRFLCTT